jgi:hypothetical protein
MLGFVYEIKPSKKKRAMTILLTLAIMYLATFYMEDISGKWYPVSHMDMEHVRDTSAQFE